MRRVLAVLSYWFLRLDLFWINAHALAGMSDLKSITVQTGKEHYYIVNLGTEWRLYRLTTYDANRLDYVPLGGITYQEITSFVTKLQPLDTDNDLLVLLRRNLSGSVELKHYESFTTGLMRV